MQKSKENHVIDRAAAMFPKLIDCSCLEWSQEEGFRTICGFSVPEPPDIDTVARIFKKHKGGGRFLINVRKSKDTSFGQDVAFYSLPESGALFVINAKAGADGKVEEVILKTYGDAQDMCGEVFRQWDYANGVKADIKEKQDKNIIGHDFLFH